jgi:CAAX protease family protein
LPTRGGLKWYLAILIGYPAILLLLGRFAAPEVSPPPSAWLNLLPLLGVTILRDPGPLGEELGWRGVALPGLLKRWPPLTASLVLGGLWGLWHLPTFFISTLSQSHLSLPLFLLGMVALSVIMTWLYLRTQGDLLLMILVHLVANFAVEARLVSFDTQILGEAVVAGLIVAVGDFRRGGSVENVSQVA